MVWDDRVMFGEDDVRNIGHHCSSQAHRTRLSTREKHRLRVVLPQRIATIEQRVQFRVGELAPIFQVMRATT